MTGMVVDAGHALHHQRDARQRPQVRVEAVRPRPLAQGFLHLPELPGIQLGFAASTSRAIQGAQAAAIPLRVPAAHALATYLQLTSNGGKNHPASGKQAAGLFAAKFKLPKISAGTNRSGHASSIDHPAAAVTILCEYVTVLCELQ